MQWQRLTELARRERELVARERWDELLELLDERQQLIDTLPRSLPPEAAPVLEESLRLSRETQLALRAGLDRTEGLLAALRRGHRVVAAYGPGPSRGIEARA